MTISGADSSGAKEAKYIAARDTKTYGYLRTFGGGGIHDVGILKGKSLTIMLVFRVLRTHALASMLGRDMSSDRANSLLI